LGAVPEASVHLVVTSPPYNAGISYDKHDDALPHEEWVALLSDVIAKAWLTLIPGGRFALNVQHGVGRSPTMLPTGAIAESLLLAQPGALYRGAIVWRQSYSGAGYTSWGSWQSPSNPVLRGEYEMIYVASKDHLDRRDRRGHGDISSRDFTFATRDVWDIAPKGRTDHPAPFPEELVRKLIQLYTWPGDHVLDPFAGSGTTGVVAQGLGRDWTMIEMSPAYCALIQRRTALFGNGVPIEEV
jgi:site-specific DNA-methyltransferase (adenine-specific)